MTYLCPIDGTSKKQAKKQNNCLFSHISKTKWKRLFLEFVTICTLNMIEFCLFSKNPYP